MTKRNEILTIKAKSQEEHNSIMDDIKSMCKKAGYGRRKIEFAHGVSKLW